MEFVLYTANNCHDCARVEAYILERYPEIQVINFDLQDAQPPFDLYAFPALLKDGKLLGYGLDIIKYLNTYSLT